MNGVYKAIGGVFIYAATLFSTGCHASAPKAAKLETKVAAAQTAPAPSEEQVYQSKGAYERLLHIQEIIKDVKADGVINPARSAAEKDEVLTLYAQKSRLEELAKNDVVKKSAELGAGVTKTAEEIEADLAGLAKSDQYKTFAIIQYQATDSSSTAWFGVYLNNNMQLNATVDQVVKAFGLDRDKFLKDNNSYKQTFGYDPEVAIVGDVLQEVRAHSQRVGTHKYANLADFIPEGGLKTKEQKTASGKPRAAEVISKEEFLDWVAKGRVKAVYIASVAYTKEGEKKEAKASTDGAALDAKVKLAEAAAKKAADDKAAAEAAAKKAAEDKATAEAAAKKAADDKAAAEKAAAEKAAAKKAADDKAAAEKAAAEKKSSGAPRFPPDK